MTSKTVIRESDFEQKILSAILHDQYAITKIIDSLQVEAFSNPQYKELYNACIFLHSKDKIVDKNTLIEYLKDANKLNRVGGVAELLRTQSEDISSENIELYAEKINEKYLRRKIVHSASKINILANDNEIDIVEVASLCEKEILNVTKTAGNKNAYNLIKTAVEGTIDESLKRYQSSISTGYTSGYTELDKLLSSINPNNLIVIAGRPGGGKTTIALNVGVNIAKRYNKPIFIFSLEMNQFQLATKLVSAECGVQFDRLEKGNLNEPELIAIDNAAKNLKELPIYINDNANITMQEIKSQCRKLHEETGGLGLIVIDYLHLIEQSNNNFKSRAEALGEFTRAFKKLANELNVPIFLLSQLNREFSKRQDKRPVISDLRESGSIEQDADVVIMIYRDEEYNPHHSKFPSIAEIIVAKNRYGAKGKAILRFQGEFHRFVNIDEKDYSVGYTDKPYLDEIPFEPIIEEEQEPEENNSNNVYDDW